MTLIKRADAIEVVHKHFTDAYDDLPTATDEDGDVIYKDTKSVNELLKHNKAISKELKALPSTDAISREECDECKTDKEGVLLQQLAELQGDYETMKNAYEDALADAEWIPCSERLPSEPFGCIVTVWDSTPTGEGDDFENILPYFVGWDGEQWNDEDGEKCPFEVIAWMPLPMPYKGGDTE